MYYMGFTEKQLRKLSDNDWAEEIAILARIRTEEKRPIIFTQ
ncbi:hypothetical protein SAMN05428988_1311 [Chitinophaga sp. YR573]|nr:hypothetical protein SAMN05428988_1311 [Chitinophaga sp. YR573]